MLLSPESLQDIVRVYPGVRLVEDSHHFEFQQRENRYLERFEVQFYLKQTSNWSHPVWFQIWKYEGDKKISLMYNDNRDVYGFAKLNEIDHIGIKMLSQLFHFVKHHPKIRLLLQTSHWKISTSSKLQVALDLYHQTSRESTFIRKEGCEACFPTQVVCENEYAFATSTENGFKIFPKEHKQKYTDLLIDEHLAIKALIGIIQDRFLNQTEKIWQMIWELESEDHLYCNLVEKI